MATASGYIRLSKEAKEQNLSREGMQDDLRALAAEHNVELLEPIHVDDGISGAVRDRPEFVAWLNDARDGRADMLLAWHGDRLTREGVNAAAMVLDVIEGKDPISGAVVRTPVRFLSFDDGLDSDDRDAFRWKFLIGAEVARAERERTIARNKAMQRRLREARRFRGGSPPFGYKVVPAPGEEKGKHLAIDAAEAKALRTVADKILNGASLYEAVKWLNDNGVKPHRANAWSMPSLKAVLTGEAVLGRGTHNGQPLRDDDGLPVALWDAVLPLDDVQRLRATLAPSGNGAGSQVRKRAARLLSGMLLCDSCKGRMRVNKSGDVTRYACRGVSDGRGCTRPVTINADLLDQHIEKEFLAVVGHMQVVRPVESLPEVVGLAEVEESLHALTRQMTEPGADVPALAAQVLALHERRATLSAAPVSTRVEFLSTGYTYAQTWDMGTVDQRRDLLADALVAEIVVAPGVPRRKGLDADRLFTPWRWTLEPDYLTGQLD